MQNDRNRRTSRLMLAFPIALAPLVSCGGGDAVRPPSSTPGAVTTAGPATAPAAAPRRLDADTPMKTSSGAAFEAPKGWFLSDKGDLLVLDNPEHDLTLTLVEVPNEPDALRAIQTAWKRVDASFARTAKQTSSPPPKDGWDSITQVVYETGGAEQRTIIAVARKKGTTEYVALIDGTNAGLDRRGAQLMTVVSTFKAAGVEEESLKGRTAHTLDVERLKRLESFVSDAMTRAKVPGLAIAVVQGGKVVYEKGFGVRELGKKDAVTPDTLFMIGSTTKSLTTLMMAKLVDEGKFGWDTPVTEVLPSFALADADVSKRVLMKHTVCACVGLPRQDMEFLFEYANATPESRVASMKAMKTTTGFGETFQYSNTMVATGGYVAAHALDDKKKLGPVYDEAMQTRVFGPLGMSHTTLDFAVAKGREHATPHAENISLEYEAIPLADEEGVVAVRPAGAAWSSVRDMSKYLMLELAHGRDPSGKQVVSEANLLKRREPEVKITDKMSYGLGLFIEDDHGVPIVHHGGNNLGFTSDMYLLPDSDVGVVMLMNAGSANALRRNVRRRMIEILFDGNDQAADSLAFALTHEHKTAEDALKKITREPESDWSRGFAGSYRSESLGVVTIRADEKRPTFDAGEWKSTFGRKTEEDGTSKLILLDPPLAGLEFVPGSKDGHTTLTLDAGQQTYAFEMQGAPKR